MKRAVSVFDFPSLVASQIASDAKQSRQFRSSMEPSIKNYVRPMAGQTIILTETDYGNLMFVCLNCNRKNILAKGKVVIAMCKFCYPAKIPD